MATNEQFCDICNLQYTTADAVEYCPECDECLCIKCKAHHSVAKLSRKHETVPLENVSKLPKFVQDIKIICNEHDERFLYYCSQHEVPCCVECIKTGHNACRSMTPIPKVVQGVKSSSSFSNLEDTLDDLLTNIEKFVQDRTDNLNSLSEQKSTCLKELRVFRNAINAYLDNLESKLNTDLQQVFSDTEASLKDLLKALNTHKANTISMKENTSLIKQYASDFQSFIAQQELSESAHKEMSALQVLFDAEATKWVDISMNPAKLPVVSAFSSLGTVNVKKETPKVSFSLRKSKEAQLIGNVSNGKQLDVKLTQKASTTISCGNKINEILGCCILTNGNLVFSDRSNRRLVILNTYGSLIKNITLPFSPSSVVDICERNVAVLGTNSCLYFFDTESVTIQKSLRLTKLGVSISRNGNNLIIENSGGNYCIVDHDGRSIGMVPTNFSEATFHPSVCLKDQFYYVEKCLNTVRSLDMNGNQIWEFQNEALVGPFGITSNNSDILFVTGWTSGNIFAISADGKMFKEIFACNGKPQGFFSTFYSVSRKELVVTTTSGNVLLFDVI